MLTQRTPPTDACYRSGEWGPPGCSLAWHSPRSGPVAVTATSSMPRTTKKQCRQGEAGVSSPTQVAPAWLPSQGGERGPLIQPPCRCDATLCVRVVSLLAYFSFFFSLALRNRWAQPREVSDPGSYVQVRALSPFSSSDLGCWRGLASPHVPPRLCSRGPQRLPASTQPLSLPQLQRPRPQLAFLQPAPAGGHWPCPSFPWLQAELCSRGCTTTVTRTQNLVRQTLCK